MWLPCTMFSLQFWRDGCWFFLQLVGEVSAALIDFAARNAVWLVRISISKRDLVGSTYVGWAPLSEEASYLSLFCGFA